MLEQESVVPLVGLLEEVPAVESGLTPVGVHPSLPEVVWQGDDPSNGGGHRPGVVENDPSIEKRGPGRIVRVRHRALQVARAGQLDIDVAVIGGSLGVDVGDPAGGLRRRERRRR